MKGIGQVAEPSRGSAMISGIASLWTSLDGQSIHEKQTVSSAWQLTAMGNEVT